MPIPGRGHKSYIQIGKQTAAGTPAAAAFRNELISADIHPEMGLIPDPSLNDQPSRRGVFQGSIVYRGTLVVRANYQGIEEFLRGVMGSYVGGSLVDSARDHTFKELGSLPFYSIELMQGAPQDVTTVTRYTDAIFTGITIRGTAGGGSDAMLQCELGVLAAGCTQTFTPTAALTAPAIWPVLYHQAITVDIGNGDAASLVRVRNFEFALQSPHADDRNYLGSVNPDVPIRNDFLTARWRFTAEFITETVLTALKAGTIGSPQLIFQNPTLIGASSKREFEIRSGLAIYTEETRPIEGYGPILANVAMEAYNDGTGDNSVAVIRTKNALAALP